MPVNPGQEYQVAERGYTEAKTVKEKIRALENMLKLAPKHKSAEKLLKQIKTNLAKYKRLEEREKEIKLKAKKSKYQISIKKEGAAQIVIVGLTNTGKSTLLNKLTNAKPLIAPYEFTTKKPEVGTMDYKGIKLQVVEFPAVTENFEEKEKGPLFLA
ncbi:MAG: GTPase, partial [Nanoarchaeota archaeon]